MQRELFDILRDTPEYKKFKNKSRIRSLLALIVIAAFWLIILATTDLSNIDDVSMMYVGILGIATFFLMRYAYGAFLKRPTIIMNGTIADIREKKRTVREKNMLQTRLTYQYLVCNEKQEYWAECIYDYIDGHAKSHSIDENVIFFSMSQGNNYIITYSYS